MLKTALIDRVLEHRFWVLGATLLVTVGAGFSLTRARFEDRVDVWFLENDPELATYHELHQRFGSDEVMVLGVASDRLFSREVLAALRRLTDKVSRLEHVGRVISLVNIEVPDGATGELTVGPFMPEVPATDLEAAALGVRALAHPLLRGNLVDRHGRATSLLVELTPSDLNVLAKRELVRALRATVATEPLLESHLSGWPVLNAAFHAYTERDLLLLSPLAMLLVGVGVFLLFRRVWAAAATLLSVVIAIIWVFAIVSLVGLKIHALLTVLPTFLLVAGVGDAVHVITEYEVALRGGRPQRQALAHAVGGLITPCFFTAATTAAGALSLYISDVKPIRDFAWLGAVGVMAAFLLTVTFLPALLSIAPTPRGTAPIFESRPLNALLAWLAHPTRRRSFVVIGVTVALLAGTVVVVPGMRVGTNAMTYFREGDPVAADTRFVDEVLGGAGRVEFLAQAPNGGFKKPAILRRVEALQAWLQTDPGITGTMSIVDILKTLRWAQANDAPEAYALPEARTEILLSYALMGQALAPFVLDDFSTARVNARFKLTEGEALAKRVPELERELQEKYDDQDLVVRVTGITRIMSKMETYLLDSQVNGFALAFLSVALLLFALLRSLKLTLLVMLPNVLPVLIGIGAMAFFEIPLDPGTAMIASLALGLIDDDTVHFVVIMREQLESGMPMPAAVTHTLERVGRPTLAMSAILALGFSALLMGSFKPNVHFATVTLIVIVLAVLGDMLLMPAVLTLASPRTAKPG